MTGMITPSLRRWLRPLPLLLLTYAVCGLPVRGAAQQAQPQLPANPLVLEGRPPKPEEKPAKAEKGQPEDPARKDYGDYKDRSLDPRATAQKEKPLPLFGYNYFEPARQLIQARRAALRRIYEEGSTNSRYGSRRRGRARTTRRGQRSGSQPGQDRMVKAPRRIQGSGNENPAEEDDGLGAAPQGVPSARLRAGGNDAEGNDAVGSIDEQNPPDSEEADQTDETAPARSRKKKNTDTGVGMEMDTDQATTQEEAARARRRRVPRNSEEDGASDSQLQADEAGDGFADDNGLGALSGRRSSRYGGRQDDSDFFSSREDRDEDRSPANAFYDVADPITQLTRNVLASVPTTYQLAGGDTLTIRYSSPTLEPQEVTRTVDPQGYLSLVEGAGRIVVRGKTLADAQADVQERLRRIYRNVQVTLSLKELRTITVTVSGEAFAPGSYTVPAVASAFNVLNAAGGPTEKGSLRRIEVRRQGKLVGTLDVYKFFITGEPTDMRLQSGDLIYIPASQSRVTVRGEVRTPAIYELNDRETLQDALHFAGGVKPSGSQSVQINTLDPGSHRVLRNVDIKNVPEVKTFPLYDGDIVNVFSVRPLVANKVTVEGAVDQPGDYELAEGMRVADLLRQAHGTLSEAYLNRVELYRWNPDNTTTLIPLDAEKALAGDPGANIALKRWDRLKVYTRQEVAWTGYRKVTVQGAVQKPGTYLRSENMHISDLLMKAGPPLPDAYLDRAVLLHQHGDGSFSYDFVNIASVLKGEKDQDKLIQDNDYLAVYKVGEAQFTPERVVSIRGEVTVPGTYPRGDGMRLSDLLSLAGGFKPGAGSTVVVAHARRTVDEQNSTLKTVSVAFDSKGRCAPNEDLQLEDGDVVTVQGTGGFLDHVQIITVKGAVNKPGPIVLDSKKMRLSDAIAKAGGLRPEAFPEGAEFFRTPQMLASTGQRSLATIIADLNNLLNDSKYQRERAKSTIELMRASGAAQNSSSFPGLGGSNPSVPNPASVALATKIANDDLVSKPRTLKNTDLEPNGNIAINLPEAMRRPGGSEDILLVDGDTITVPEKPTTVQVVGAVVNGRAVLFRPGARLEYYVEQAGGFAPDAAKDRIVIIHAGGGLIPANRVRELRPGDVIMVPNRVLAEKISSNQNGFDSFFRSVTSSAIIFKLATSLFGL
ncbi:MAG TPA: SLBB domain-containing protein [Chthonomonadaceae bacterium]|nr:SLBB domain-containing protein [Chthonomonadaceae bacterium]